MQTLRLSDHLLPEFIESLKAWGAVWAPVERAPGVFDLEVIDDVRRARPDALRTILPFKKLLIAPRFTMLAGKLGEIPEDPGEGRRGRQVFFGAHACDVHALRILDLLHLANFQDPYYLENRRGVMVVGYGCWPDERCFYASLDTSTVDDGFDLFLTDLMCLKKILMIFCGFRKSRKWLLLIRYL